MNTVLWGDSTEAKKCNLYNHLAAAENEDYCKAPASITASICLSFWSLNRNLQGVLFPPTMPAQVG